MSGLNFLHSLPEQVAAQFSETDQEVIRLICAWAIQDPNLSTEMQGRTIREFSRPSICRNMSTNSWFVKIETKEWSSYSHTNWWRGRAWRNSYEHPLKVLGEMLTEAFENAKTDPDETTEYMGGV